MAAKSGGENNFCETLPVDSADTLRIKNFIEIALARSISEINAFLSFTQKFKMAAKIGGEKDFCENLPVVSSDTLWVKKFVKITLIMHCFRDKRVFAF